MKKSKKKRIKNEALDKIVKLVEESDRDDVDMIHGEYYDDCKVKMKPPEKKEIDGTMKCGNCGAVIVIYSSQQKYCSECSIVIGRIKKNESYHRMKKANPERFRLENKKRNSLRKGKIKAINKVNWALKSGKLKKPTTCQSCGSKKDLQSHHWDYSKELDVIWLCKLCHKYTHKLIDDWEPYHKAELLRVRISENVKMLESLDTYYQTTTLFKKVFNQAEGRIQQLEKELKELEE